MLNGNSKQLNFIYFLSDVRRKSHCGAYNGLGRNTDEHASNQCETLISRLVRENVYALFFRLPDILSLVFNFLSPAPLNFLQVLH
uniref:Uncharacterized protein n=1 Tax=Medicago truncatula TaxID=3880 RepID=A2Q1I4_MEDTR|nr:hypothetical protein MtrDRAFT_AC155886g2v2 [Medicago truncatula]